MNNCKRSIRAASPEALTLVVGVLEFAAAGQYSASTSTNNLPVGVTDGPWIPGDAPRARGVIIYQPGAGTTAFKEGFTAAYDLHWQALARSGAARCPGPYFHFPN